MKRKIIDKLNIKLDNVENIVENWSIDEYNAVLKDDKK